MNVGNVAVALDENVCQFSKDGQIIGASISLFQRHFSVEEFFMIKLCKIL